MGRASVLEVGLLLLIALCLLAAPQESREPQIPPGAGQTIMNEACVQCHDFRNIVSQRKTPEQWRRTVNEMIWKGAPLMPGEAATLTDYLVKSFPAGRK
jgi:predicted secreted protein